MQWLKQSTSVDVNFGPFIDDTDFKSTLSGLSPSTSISKNGAAYGAGPTGSHQSDGHYSITLSTTHTNTLGSLRVMCKATGALSVWRDFQVVPANVYDSLVGGSDTLQADVTQFGGTNGTFDSGRPEVKLGNVAHGGASATLTISTFTVGAESINGIGLDAGKALWKVDDWQTFILATTFPADVIAISSDATAANNAEAFFDGTGYAGGTIKLGVDAVQISGDTTAANNLEALLDGTGGVSLSASEFLLTTPIVANVTQIGTNSTAASNCTLFFNGTGYAGGTTKLGVNAVQISDDTGAANNLEAFFDGTGYNASTSTVGTVTTAVNVTTVNGLAASVVNASALATDAVTEITAGIWNAATSSYATVGTFGQQLQEIRSGTAQGGTSSSITLDASASSVTNFYNDSVVQITAGTGVRQARKITSYNGTSKVATVNPAWGTTPSSDSVFTIHPHGADAAASLTAAQCADAVWDELRADHVISGSFGEYTLSDMVRISGDATAANNLEAVLDGTGGVSLAASEFLLTTPIVANVTQWLTNTVATTSVNGVPKVDITHISSAAVNTASAQLGVNVVSMAANSMTASALATDAVDEIWEYATTNIATAGGIGKLIVDNLNATVSSRSSHSAADVWAVATRVVTAATNITSTGAAVPITAGGLVSADMTAISTDATAANNLEAALDGTGGVSITATFAGNLSGNVTGSVGSIAAGGIAAASFAAGAIDATAIATGAIDADAIAAEAIGSSELAASAATEIADAILSRSVSNVEGTAGEHTLCTVVLALLEWAISGTTWTIYRTDGTTTHATKTLTAAASDPITSVA